MNGGLTRLCLAGDVMLGRGIDQIQAHPGDPVIHEPSAGSALSYVELAERRTGPIPREVGPSYVWGDHLSTIHDAAADAFVVNLETAVTDRGRPWPGKQIQYRMHPANAAVLEAAGVGVVSLANNHVLDWSEPGLFQTLDALDRAGIAAVGAGVDAARAWEPVRMDLATGSLVVMGVGAAGSGIPAAWAATAERAGVALLPDFSRRTVDLIAAAIDRVARSGDLVMLSIHWGGNWGYGISTARRRFARRLIDEAGIHVIHGHSSHHPTAVEVHRGRLILYGCGDLITDYEGISGHERFRSDLGALYLASIDSVGHLAALSIVPTRMRRFQLTTPTSAERAWLASQLSSAGRAHGTSVAVDPDGDLRLVW